MLYTLDQVATCLEVSVGHLNNNYAHFDGRSVGIPGKGKIIFRNIASEGEKPEWRCSEREFVRWLKYKGFQYYERGWVSH